MEEKNALEILQEGIENTEIPDVSILKDAEDLAKKLYAKPKKQPRKIWLAIGSIALSCAALVLCIVFSYDFFKPNLPATRYFANEQVKVETVDDLSEFLKEKNLNILCFENEFAKNSAAYINETNELAYIFQKSLFIEETSMDEVELSIVFLKNCEFEKFEDYENLTNSIIVEQTEVKYEIVQNDNDKSVIIARFMKKFEYNLQIVTANADGKLEYYINKLLN